VYYDSHAHFRGAEGPQGWRTLAPRSRAAEVAAILAVGGDAESNTAAADAAAGDPGLFRAALGWDRDHADSPAGPEALAGDLRRLLEAASARGSRVAAIGETGLDYHCRPDTAAQQRRLFEAQVALARERALPLVIHSRDADDDTLAALRGTDSRGVLHCFTGTRDFARRLLDLGLYISFSGIVTFRNADELRDVARYVPPDRILAETDSPYLSPVPYRGQPNEPARVAEVVRCLAEARAEQPGELAGLTTANAVRLFGGP
jgi:TatD DNase family protein